MIEKALHRDVAISIRQKNRSCLLIEIANCLGYHRSRNKRTARRSSQRSAVKQPRAVRSFQRCWDDHFWVASHHYESDTGWDSPSICANSLGCQLAVFLFCSSLEVLPLVKPSAYPPPYSSFRIMNHHQAATVSMVDVLLSSGVWGRLCTFFAPLARARGISIPWTTASASCS